MSEQINLDYVTPEMVRLCTISMQEKGRIFISSSANEFYINMKGGSIPTLIRDTNPQILHEKYLALEYVKNKIEEMWNTGFILQLMSKVKVDIYIELTEKAQSNES